MNLEALNRYVLGAIGLFAVLVYAGIVFSGCTDLISHLQSRSTRRKRPRNQGAIRKIRGARKSN